MELSALQVQPGEFPSGSVVFLRRVFRLYGRRIAGPSDAPRQTAYLRLLHTSSNRSSPNFSRLQAILSPGFSQTRLSGGRP